MPYSASNIDVLGKDIISVEKRSNTEGLYSFRAGIGSVAFDQESANVYEPVLLTGRCTASGFQILKSLYCLSKSATRLHPDFWVTATLQQPPTTPCEPVWEPVVLALVLQLRICKQGRTACCLTRKVRTIWMAFSYKM